MKLSDFTLLKEHPDAYEIGHPKGKSIRVPKEGLSTKAHEHIKKMASGGEVEGDNQTWATKDPVADYAALSDSDPSHLAPNQQDRLDAYNGDADRAPAGIFKDLGANLGDNLREIGKLGTGIKNAVTSAASDFASGFAGPQNAQASEQPPVPQEPSPTNYSVSTQRQPAAPSKPVDMSGMSQGYNTMIQGGNEQIQAAQDMAKAEGSLGSEKMALDTQHIKDVQAVQKDYQSQLSDINNEYNAALKDVQNFHINPDHYFESKSTAGKVATAIGLVLGGIGGGLTGKANPALEFLNNQMNRDIEAQKSELGKKETILSANLRKFGNLNDATLMTQAMQAGIYTTQLDAAAAKSMDPMAAARAKALSGEIKQKVIGPALQGLAQQRALQNFMRSNNTGQSTNPARSVMMMQKMGVMDEPTAKQAMLEVGKSQDHGKQVQVIMNAFEKANQENTIMGRASHLGSEPASIGVIQSALMPYLKDAEGRINESELQRTDKLIPRPGDSPQKIKEKRMGLMNFLKEKGSTPTLDAYGISVSPPPQFNPR